MALIRNFILRTNMKNMLTLENEQHSTGAVYSVTMWEYNRRGGEGGGKCEKKNLNFNRIRPSLWRFRHIDVNFCIQNPLKRGLSLTNLKDKMKKDSLIHSESEQLREFNNVDIKLNSFVPPPWLDPLFWGREHTIAAFIAGNDDYSKSRENLI